MRPRKNHGYVIVTKQRTSGRRTVAQVSFPLIRHSSLTLFLFPFLTLSPSLTLFLSLSLSPSFCPVSFRSPVSQPIVSRFLSSTSLCSLSTVADQISLSLVPLCPYVASVVFLCIFSTSYPRPGTSVSLSLFLFRDRERRTNEARFPLEKKKRKKWKLPAEVTWSSAHEFPVTFRDTRSARGSCRWSNDRFEGIDG